VTLSIKPRLSKKCIAFTAIFPLLIVTSLVNAECPVCQGDGLVSSAPGMDNVVVIDFESKGPYAMPLMLMVPAGFVEDISVLKDYHIYNVILTVVNNGPDDISGYVKFLLVDVTEDRVLLEGYRLLEIPGETSLDVPYTFLCKSTEDLSRLPTKFNAEVVTNDAPDVTCNGTGKTPLNSWLLVNVFKDSLLELGGEGVQYETGMVFD